MDLKLVRSQFGNIALADALAAARDYAERSLSESTRRSYARDLAAFRAWCHTRSINALPAEPQTFAAYLADLAVTDKPAAIGRKVAAIAVAHRDAGLESPTERGMVKRTLAGIRREKGTAQNQKRGAACRGSAAHRRVAGNLAARSARPGTHPTSICGGAAAQRARCAPRE